MKRTYNSYKKNKPDLKRTYNKVINNPIDIYKVVNKPKKKKKKLY